MYKKRVTLSFNANGHGTAPASVSGDIYTNSNNISVTTSVSLKTGAAMSASGYDFLGWFTSTYRSTPMYYYADSYSDLKEKIGYNAKDLRVYYLESGKSEERTKYREYAPGVSISIKVNTTLYSGWHKD